jgi:hypothetical protein
LFLHLDPKNIALNKDNIRFIHLDSLIKAARSGVFLDMLHKIRLDLIHSVDFPSFKHYDSIRVSRCSQVERVNFKTGAMGGIVWSE